MTDEHECYKVFCGNFEYGCTLSEMETLFEKYGEFDRIDMKTGFCFVYFKHKSDGQASIDDLDGMQYGKARRPLKLEWAKGDGRIKLREEKRRQNIVPNPTLFVVNFDPSDTTEDDFADEFGRFGALERVQVKKNFAFVQFKDLEDAKDALAQLNGTMLKGRKITVEYVATAQEDRLRDRSPPPRRYEPRGYERDRYDRDRYDRDRYDRDHDREAYLRGPSHRDSYRDRSPPRRRDYSPDRRRRMPSPRPYRRERSPLPYRRRSRS